MEKERDHVEAEREKAISYGLHVRLESFDKATAQLKLSNPEVKLCADGADINFVMDKGQLVQPSNDDEDS